MHKVALFNGKIINVHEANLSGLSVAALYGNGIFTTIAIYDGKPFLLDKHLRRLQKNADAIGLNVGDEKYLGIDDQLDELILENSVVDGRARVTLFDASMSRMWSDDRTERVDSLIITADQRKVPPRLNLTVSPYAINSTSPITGVKSCNYLENMLAINEAKSRGFHEAIRLNERGEVTSACMANVFWLNGDQLFTPSLSTGCLAGTTREWVMERFNCREAAVGMDELLSADSIFITSAGIGIRQVDRLNELSFVDSTHPLLELLPTGNKKTRMSVE